MSEEFIFGEDTSSSETTFGESQEENVFGVHAGGYVDSMQGVVDLGEGSSSKAPAQSNMSGGIPVTQTSISDECYGVHNENSVEIEQVNVSQVAKIGLGVLIIIVLIVIFIMLV